MRLQGLYAIVDATTTQRMTAASLEDVARDYVRGGASVIQLRDKNRRQDPVSFYKTAEAVAGLKKNHDFIFIVNDEPETARDVGADGVHVGQDDVSIEECRRILGPEKWVGYSSHSLEEAGEAEKRGADYVALGAIFPTPTKGPGHPVQGLEKLREAVQALRVPVVAIGGIGRPNLEDVLATGVVSVAMISALLRSADRVEECRFFSAAIG